MLAYVSYFQGHPLQQGFLFEQELCQTKNKQQEKKQNLFIF